MNKTAQMWGNSLAVRIPSEIAKKSGIKVGTPIEFQAGENSLTIKPLKPLRKTIDELLKGYKPEMKHELVDW